MVYMMLRTMVSTLFMAAAARHVPSTTTLRAAATFYDVLKLNGLPIGLFPKGISNFTTDCATGRFQLHFASSPSPPCDATFDETSVRYQWYMTGDINKGNISNLFGVATHELFLWLPVRSIQVDDPCSGLIYFDTGGGIIKQFSVSSQIVLGVLL